MKKEALYLLYAEVIFEFTSWNYDSYKLPYPQDAQAARRCTVKKIFTHESKLTGTIEFL